MRHRDPANSGPSASGVGPGARDPAQVAQNAAAANAPPDESEFAAVNDIIDLPPPGTG